MKVQIRRGLFETNSSSVHSITIVPESEIDKWREGKLFFSYDEGRLIPISEIENYDPDWISNFEDFGDEYETFFEKYTSPSGDKIVAFGYYGHD